MSCEMSDIEKAIKHFKCASDDARVVLDSGFGKAPNQNPSLYKRRKLYADLAIDALEKQIPEKPQKSESGMFDICPTCGRFINRREKPHGNIDIPRCKWCGQKLDWSDTK